VSFISQFSEPILRVQEKLSDVAVFKRTMEARQTDACDLHAPT
jgi:hypothetical protein